MGKTHARDMVLIAEFAIILAILSQITIPFGPVPFTLQTFGVMLLGSTLKPKQSIFSVLLYLLLGLIGLPVFAGGVGGVTQFINPLTGFLLAFVPGAALLSLWIQKFGRPDKLNIGAHLLSSLLILLLGTIWLKFFTHGTWSSAFLAAFVPFIVPELLKAAVASLLALKLRPIIYRVKAS
ncbi:biotin transporter BioY [Agrilactobacillus fermenti]|uniref:biotin transporter BioY n=1 Tax=Agrilactobacillus fermenti TaxID=2586909 RepID=UPI001E2DCCAC|nr:biotin transporter BioY [Agrilactobacillus fermenti]MCD2255539.1 biotin transporter BioY [Agrilactobacillus fermenti]